MNMFAKTPCFSSALLTGAALADPYMEMSIPLEWAQTAATVASQSCAGMGFATTVTVANQRA